MKVPWMRRAARVAALLLTLGPPRVAAEDLDRETVARRLQGWLDGTRELTCRFEQRLLSGALGTGPLESGTVYLLRPGRMRWEYVEPEAKTALLEGDRTVIYLPEDRQLIRGRLPREGCSIHRLLAGTGRIEDLFSAFLVATPRAGGQGAYRLRLVPKEATEGFEEVTLVLRPPAFAIEEAQVLDAAGNRIVYRFSHLRRNRGLPDTVFHLERPPGTEIVESQ